VFCYGNNKKYNILVLQLLGKSLEQLFNHCGKKLSLKSTCILGIQMIERIKFVHENFHLHRDIKPDNFVMGINENENKVFVIDFGLSKKYKSQSKGTHIPFKTNKNMTGTARYCSINTHLGYEQSRRDDLESIGYVLLYFLKGNLPWQGLKLKPEDNQYKKICEEKQAVLLSVLCAGLPSNFF
jgi:serine/threonine protein kinase